MLIGLTMRHSTLVSDRLMLMANRRESSITELVYDWLLPGATPQKKASDTLAVYVVEDVGSRFAAVIATS